MAAVSGKNPGRDPGQAIDEAHTKKILEYPTEPFFLSPLVHYLPASKTVPTPQAVIGDIAGAPGKLPYSEDRRESHLQSGFTCTCGAPMRMKVFCHIDPQSSGSALGSPRPSAAGNCAAHESRPRPPQQVKPNARSGRF